MTKQIIQIGNKTLPVFFPYAALKELEEVYQMDGNRLLIKSASNWTMQFNLAWTGIKYGHLKNGNSDYPSKEELEFILEPKHFDTIQEIFIQSFPEPSKEDKEAAEQVAKKLMETDGTS